MSPEVSLLFVHLCGVYSRSVVHAKFLSVILFFRKRRIILQRPTMLEIDDLTSGLFIEFFSCSPEMPTSAALSAGDCSL